MFVRTKRVTKGGKTYTYGQIVRSYRRPGGKPRQELVASLGKLEQLEVDNLRIALSAATDGETVTRLVGSKDTPVVRSSLDYLPIAVVLEMCERTGLTALLSRLLDEANTSSPNSKVVLALIAQRLIAPGSKLAGVEWFQRTALPDALTFPADELNYSRVHRVLNALGDVRPELQLGVAQLHKDSTHKGHALFLDVSDTWFEGRGPKSAQRAKTKEGAYKKKIGIVLVCNKMGLPVGWDVVEGRRHDSKSMGDMAIQLVGMPGLSKLPMVFDRAMGKKKTLQELTDAGVRFVTLMTSESYDGYARDELALEALVQIQPRDEDDVQAQAAALDCVQSHGFEQIGRKLWGKTLGVRRYHKRKPSKQHSNGAGSSRHKPERGARPHVVQAMCMAEEIQAFKETGAANKKVYARFGINRYKAYYLSRLLLLRSDIREAVRNGRCWASVDALHKIGALEPNEQLAAFEPYRLGTQGLEPSSPETEKEQPVPSGPPIRFVLAFDPAAFAAARFKANAHDREIHAEVERLSLRLVRREIKQQTAETAITKLLAKYSLSDCYEATTTQSSARVQRHDDIWQRKRRTDGFRLFAVHPDLRVTPKRVINLYSEKMAVEVDFHVIKSTVKIRPVHHNTEAKVRTHVDLCVLALAVERALNAALPKALSAPAALRQLETVRLITISPTPSTTPIRVLTTPTAEQKRLLRHLDMLHLTRFEPM